MTQNLNSKSFELLYETFLKNKHLLSKVVANRMNTYFKEVAKVLDLYKSYIEFLENENAFINTEEKEKEKTNESDKPTRKKKRTRRQTEEDGRST
tara:strand:+ start:1760 stop:2044 length:285 start_codon:yes stop_codon:yes gene_type:complete